MLTGSSSRLFKLMPAFLAASLLLPSLTSANASPIPPDNFSAIVLQALDTDNIQPILDIEAQSLPASAGRALRTDDTLVLKLASGEQKALQDSPQCALEAEEAHCEMFRLVGYQQRADAFIVAHVFYEDLQFMLINAKSGAATEFMGFPIFSPSGAYALVLRKDVDTDSEIQIWEQRNGALSLSWAAAPKTDGLYTVYKFVSWPEEDSIEVQSETARGGQPTDTLASITLQRADGQWTIAGSNP